MQQLKLTSVTHTKYRCAWIQQGNPFVESGRIECSLVERTMREPHSNTLTRSCQGRVRTPEERGLPQASRQVPHCTPRSTSRTQKATSRSWAPTSLCCIP